MKSQAKGFCTQPGARRTSDFDRVLREVRMIEGVANSQTSLLLSTV